MMTDNDEPSDGVQEETDRQAGQQVFAPRLSVVVPAYNCAEQLQECLTAILEQADERTQVIVADDASSDTTASVAQGMGVEVVRLTKNSGPAAARNKGVTKANGDILLFVDADVVIAPHVLERVIKGFESDPDLGALFGSYDTEPRAKGVISQYRNLLHHIMHQTASEDARTFWSGLGAIRREVFLKAWGFDTKKFPKPSIEDIELGYRLRNTGHKIRLDKGLQGTHLKHWGFMNMVKTDIFDRAYPWAYLILQTGKVANDLNVSADQRLSVLLTPLVFLGLVLGFYNWMWFGVALAVLSIIVFINRWVFARFLKIRSFGFTLLCVPLHTVYLTCSGIGAALALAEVVLNSLNIIKRSGRVVSE